MEIKELFDQSVFVSASVDSLLREGAIAAGLTALMILLFLGSWRSTLVVMISTRYPSCHRWSCSISSAIRSTR